MSVYTVKNVSPETREWSSKQGGQFISYTIDLEDESGVLARAVEWSRKPTSRAPQEGEQVAGHIEEGRYGEKFKMDYEATKELGRGSSSALAPSGFAKSSWQPESKYDPEKVARMGRAHAQEMALRWAAILGDKEITLPKLFQITDAFERDVEEAGQAAAGRVETPQDGPQVPAPAPQGDTAEWFTKLLEDAAVTAETALKLGSYIAEKFSDEQRQRASEGLRDLDTQKKTIDQLVAAYEKTEGKPLSAPKSDEDIPF